MATATVQRAEAPITSVTLVLSEGEAQSLARLLNQDDLALSDGPLYEARATLYEVDGRGVYDIGDALEAALAI